MNWYDGTKWHTVSRQLFSDGLSTSGRPIRFAVEVNGRAAQAFVNERPLRAWEAAAPIAGQVGFDVHPTTLSNAQVVFTDLRVTELVAGLVIPPENRDNSAAPVLPGTTPQPKPQAQAPTSPTDSCMRIVGTWQWYTNAIQGVLGFGSDHRVSASAFRGRPAVLWGTWTCDGATSGYVISWQNTVVERVTMAQDGQSITGTNNYNMLIRGYPLR